MHDESPFPAKCDANSDMNSPAPAMATCMAVRTTVVQADTIFESRVLFVKQLRALVS